MAQFASHGALVANTPATVSLAQQGIEYVEVVNRTGSAEIFFTVDGSTPTPGADDTYIVPAGICSYRAFVATSSPVVVKLECTAVQSYSVIGGAP